MATVRLPMLSYEQVKEHYPRMVALLTARVGSDGYACSLIQARSMGVALLGAASMAHAFACRSLYFPRQPGSGVRYAR